MADSPKLNDDLAEKLAALQLYWIKYRASIAQRPDNGRHYFQGARGQQPREVCPRQPRKAVC